MSTAIVSSGAINPQAISKYWAKFGQKAVAVGWGNGVGEPIGVDVGEGVARAALISDSGASSHRTLLRPSGNTPINTRLLMCIPCEFDHIGLLLALWGKEAGLLTCPGPPQPSAKDATAKTVSRSVPRCRTREHRANETANRTNERRR